MVNATATQELLIRKTKESGATFNVCRIPLSKMKAEGESRTTYTRPSQAILIMLEELMVIFETAVLSQKRMKTDFNKLLKKKFVENAEKYAFMDPFADEFEYAAHKISFSGAASDKELINGVIDSVRELAQELGLLPELRDSVAEWSDKYSKQLANFSVEL